MKVKSNKLYIDYLDHTMGEKAKFDDLINRLKFDLLLFSEDVLCMSVPACVKLDSTADILMKLTPFWKNHKIKLILDHKHQNNPWNYFNNRKRKLEKQFAEQDLLCHFEYHAYNSPHTEFFYNTFVDEVVNISKSELYVDKVFDTDELFRRSIQIQIEKNEQAIYRKIPNDAMWHMSKVFTDLFEIAEDRRSLFQRTAIEQKLKKESGATYGEIGIVSRMLDTGFAYANGISSYAAPISLITNRLTGRVFLKMIQSSDPELFHMIIGLSWPALYKLSISDVWVDFVDHMNKVLLLYQGAQKHKDELFKADQIRNKLNCWRLLTKLYEAAIENIQTEFLKIGATIVDVTRMKEFSDLFVEQYFYHKAEYFSVSREIDELLNAIKITIKSIERKYRDSTTLLREEGFIICIDKDFI